MSENGRFLHILLNVHLDTQVLPKKLNTNPGNRHSGAIRQRNISLNGIQKVNCSLIPYNAEHHLDLHEYMVPARVRFRVMLYRYINIYRIWIARDPDT